jgi:hypothetical protein
LLLTSKESRLKELGHMQGGWQEFIVVASLIDHIPNLASLACTYKSRSCSVFWLPTNNYDMKFDNMWQF